MTMPSAAPQQLSFRYEAQGPQGQSLSGTLWAADGAEAQHKLESLQLRVVNIEQEHTPRTRPVKGDDFQSFNQQLAYLTQAGLPVERGLRLIADEMNSPRMAATVRDVAKDLESGVGLADAFERHRNSFPPLYGKLIDAGIQTHNLPGILLDFGRHLELIARLRQSLWRAVSYPLGVLLAFCVVLGFMMYGVLPQFVEIFNDFRTSLPALTELFIHMSLWFKYGLGLPVFIGVIVACLMAAVVISASPYLIDTLILPIPILGSAIRRARLAQWCNAFRLGIDGGLPLPQAMSLASDAVMSPGLSRDVAKLRQQAEVGAPLSDVRQTKVVLPSLTSALDMGASSHNLSETTRVLAVMYTEQAEAKIRMMPAIITPVFMLGIGGFIMLTVIAMFLPLVKLIQGVSGGN